MARPEPNQGLVPSMLDRLIDPATAGTAWRRGYGVEQVIATVQRDLEELLNTRPAYDGPAEDFPEVQRSIVAYGLPDLGSFQAHTAQQRSEIGRSLEGAIARFEPRLRDIRASLIDAGDNKTRTVRFRIDARLSVDPAPEVAFETVVELATGHYSVQAASP